MTAFKVLPAWECDDIRATGSPVTLTRRQRCRNCGQPILAGEQAREALHNFDPYGYSNYWRQFVYVHAAPCERTAS